MERQNIVRSGGVLKNKLKVLWAVILITLLIGSLGISYAYFNAVDSNKTTANVILKGKTGCIDVSLTENKVELQYNYPITDEYAMDNVNPITITIKNNCSNDDVDYSLVITTLSNYEDEDEENLNIPASKIKTKIDKNNETLIETNFLNEINKLKDNTTTKKLIDNKLNSMDETKDYNYKNTYVIDKEKITKDSTITYEIYMWIDYNEGGENNSTKGKTFENIISVVVNNPEDSVKAGVPSAGEYVLAQKPSGLSEKLLGDMYRFVGGCNAGDSNGNGCDNIVDNFVCFGYNDPSQCVKKTETGIDLDNDYIYRIIGITEDGQMKLIKNTAITENEGYENYYEWHKSYAKDITWPESDLFKRLNGQGTGTTHGIYGNTNLFINSETSNVQYIKTTGNTTWYNKIDSNHEWLYGGIFNINLDKSADEIYKIESGQQAVQQNYGEDASLWKAKAQAAVGLMYVSDYYYSYAPSGTDSTNTNCYSNTSCKNSWMHISNDGKSADYQYEWTMARNGREEDDDYSAWGVKPDGTMAAMLLGGGTLYGSNSIRSVFYLKSNVKIFEGIGTSTEPFIISQQ